MFASYVEQVLTVDPRNKKLHKSVYDGWIAVSNAVGSSPAFYQSGITLTRRKCQEKYERLEKNFMALYKNPGTNGSDKQDLTPIQVILKRTGESKDLAAETCKQRAQDTADRKKKRESWKNSIACVGPPLRETAMRLLRRHLLLRPEVKMNSKFTPFVEPRSASLNVFPPMKLSVSFCNFPLKKWLNLHQKKRANIRDRLISCENVKNWIKMIILHCARATTTTTAQVSVGE
jgi:hypothetical protein